MSRQRAFLLFVAAAVALVAWLGTRHTQPKPSVAAATSFVDAAASTRPCPRTTAVAPCTVAELFRGHGRAGSGHVVRHCPESDTLEIAGPVRTSGVCVRFALERGAPEAAVDVYLHGSSVYAVAVAALPSFGM